MNPAACELVGYTREELLKMRIGDLSTPAARETTLECYRRTLKEGWSTCMVDLRRKDGTVVTVESHATHLGDGNSLSIVHDVSERVAAQEALKRSHDAYATLVRICQTAVISAGPDGRIASWNPAAENLLGYAENEAVGLPVTKLMPSRLRRKFRAAFMRHVRSTVDEPIGRTIRATALRKDGTEIQVEVSAAVGMQDSGKVFTAVVRDVSEHTEMVERLNDALQRLQFHVERMPLAYIVWDVDFRAVEWNPAAERTFGYRKSEAVGKHAYDLIVPPQVIPMIDQVWADLLKGDTSSHSVNVNRRKDGSQLTCEWFNTPVRDSGGRIRGVCSMAMDISEREEMEAQLRNAQKLESLGVLAGGVAHDFNSALMVILGNTALLRSLKGLPAKSHEYIELIEEASFRAKDFIDHLLAYARTGRHHPHAIDLNMVVQDVLTLVRSSIGKTHHLERRLAKQLPDILADISQIEQVILNLCLNADQALSDEGTIEIKTGVTTLTAKRAARCVPHGGRTGRYVELVVSDNGSGMDKATMTRIFDPFFTTKTGGHGLGLAAVLGILRQHNAAVVVDSAVGKGTKVHVFLPLHKPKLKAKRDAASRKRRA